jgi:hypothetical protein
METLNVNGFSLAGNDFLTIAINDLDPEDAHYFFYTKGEGPDPDITAMDNAVAWTSPGA